MRPFDIAGILFVALWLGAVGAFVMFADDDDARGMPLTDGDIDLREETTWMAVYRDGDQVGMLREDRTRLIDGWLVELQGVAELTLMGDSHAFRFSSRTTLDEELTVRTATGTVEAFGRTLNLTGQLREDGDDVELHVDLRLDDAAERFIADLETNPRLVSHAIPEIIASDDLEVGDRFREEFLDPITLSPTDLEITYEGREVIETHTGPYESYDFVQSVGQFDTRLFVDSRGMPLFQALPMSVVARRIPDEIGPSQYREFNDKLEDAIDESPPFVDAIDARDLLSIVARFGGGDFDRLRAVDDAEQLLVDQADAPADTGDDTDDDEPLEVEITDLRADLPLDIFTPRQHVAIHTSERARVEAGVDNPLWHAGQSPQNSSYQPVADPDESPLLDELVGDMGDVDADASPALPPETLRRLTEEHCSPDVLDAPDAFIDADSFIDAGWPDKPVDAADTPIECLALFADAFTALGAAPHLVHGAVHHDGDFAPHLWLALYIDGHYRGEFDPFAETGRPGADHVQLYLGDHFTPDLLDELTDQLQVH